MFLVIDKAASFFIKKNVYAERSTTYEQSNFH